MLYHLFYPLHEAYSIFNVFRYITFRTIYAILTALLITLILGPYLIKKLQALNIKQYIREDGPSAHLNKSGTPTMGGILILLSLTIATLFWGDLTNIYIWIALLT
ncbi:MAG: phospho-N-acetylmuramoyl-pentapeptide-transferase, partial [Deltaproteobacteria bacterium]|nr:phospho-N-acetylmuramoyl-pentapeptide-transferase [Deltaproteobacteria bacterium]